jgi:hypothetical protein
VSSALNQIVTAPEEAMKKPSQGLRMMRQDSPNESVLQASSLVGIVASFALFYSAFFVPGLSALTAPASALFLGSLLYVTR